MKNHRILAMRTAGTIAPFIIDEIVNAFNSLGHQAITLDFTKMQLYEKTNSQIVSNVLKIITDFKPSFIISYGTAGIIEIQKNSGFSHLAEELNIPYCLLFFDAPYSSKDFLQNFSNSKLMKVFCWDRYYFPFFTDCGIKEIHYLPLATNPDVFSPILSENINENKISFVGTLNVELLKTPPPASSALLPIVQNFLKKRLTYPTKHFEELLEEIIAVLSLDNKQLFKQFQNSSDFTVFRQDIQRRADALYRYHAILSLSHKHIVSIFGNQGWHEFFQDNRNVLYKGHIEYGKKLARIYNNSEISLNLTVMQLVQAVNQRIFDCPAAGGFLLTDYRKDLEELFDINEEIVCFKDINEMIDKVDEFIVDVSKRNTITHKARKRILANHTWKHRAEKILSVIFP